GMIPRVVSLAPLMLLGSACATRPEPVSVENVEEVSATIQAIDVETRLVVLRGPDGDTIGLRVDPSVQNLAEIKAGDRVVARYYDGLAAELRRRGDGSGETQAPVVDAAVGSATEGRPAGIIRAQTRQTVRVTGVNNKSHVVSFYGSDGVIRTLPVSTPQG